MARAQELRIDLVKLLDAVTVRQDQIESVPYRSAGGAAHVAAEILCSQIAARNIPLTLEHRRELERTCNAWLQPGTRGSSAAYLVVSGAPGSETAQAPGADILSAYRENEAKLQKQVKTLQQEARRQNDENYTLHMRLKESLKRLRELNEESQIWLDEKRRLEAERGRLAREAQESKSQMESLKKESLDQRKENRGLQLKVTEMEESIAAVQGELATAREEIEALRRQVEELRDEAHRATEGAAKVEQMLSDNQQSVAALTADVAELKKQVPGRTGESRRPGGGPPRID